MVKKAKAKNQWFVGARCSPAKPTKNHRPAIWECILGTVYALSPEGEVKYFDYDYTGARVFAEVDPAGDNRIYKITRELSFQYVKKGPGEANPGFGKLVLWVPKTAPKEEVLP